MIDTKKNRTQSYSCKELNVSTQEGAKLQRRVQPG